MAASHSEQAGVLVLGKILATLSEAIVPLAIVRLLGKADVGILSSILLVYSTVALVLTAGFPETLTFFLPTRTPAERRAIALNVARSLLLLGLLGAVVLVGISVLARFASPLTNSVAGRGHASLSSVESLKYLPLLAIYPIADLPGRMLPNLLIVEQRTKAAAGIGTVKAIGSALAALLPIALQAPLWVVVLSIPSFGFCFGAVLLYYIRTLYSGVEVVASPISIKALLRFGLPLGLTDIVLDAEQSARSLFDRGLLSSHRHCRVPSGRLANPYHHHDPVHRGRGLCSALRRVISRQAQPRSNRHLASICAEDGVARRSDHDGLPGRLRRNDGAPVHG
jgi:O-antigen/teichoic acid export membrane protein